MFKEIQTRIASERTRALILTTALEAFRQRGVNAVTMREIARSAGVALGAAYYYFPSKEAMVQAYYDQAQADHLARVSSQLAVGKPKLLERLKIAFHAKVDILKSDRELLGTLFRYTGEPRHPLSIFSSATRVNRQQSIAVFRLALGDERVPADIRVQALVCIVSRAPGVW